jgi:hypothetical protein
LHLVLSGRRPNGEKFYFQSCSAPRLTDASTARVPTANTNRMTSPMSAFGTKRTSNSRSTMSVLGIRRTFLPTTISVLMRRPRHLGPLMAWPARAVRCPAGTGTQRHFEPFCFFFQADPAQLTYQPCPIMRYSRAKSCRNFFIRVSHARSRRVGKKSILQPAAQPDIDVGQIVLASGLSCASH